MIDLDAVLLDPPLVHEGGALTWGLDRRVLEYLDRGVQPGQVTLETGIGLSTVVFALRGSSHHVLVPDAGEVARVSDYCRQHGIPTTNLNVHLGYSERILPSLALPPLDLVLIDGCHGFPAPFLDWYYTAEALRVGGALIIDDVQIWTCRLLSQFLSSERGWRRERSLGPRTALFTKTAPFDPSREWSQQPFVLRRSHLLIARQRFRRALELAREARFGEILRRLRR